MDQLEKDLVRSILSLVVVMREIWLTCNEFAFHKQSWKDIKVAWRCVLKLKRSWRPLYKEEMWV
jgi:hypothetical protein